MSNPMHIPDHEYGVIRLFAIDLPPEDIAAFKTAGLSKSGDVQWPLKAALGATDLDQDFVEVFPISDLDGLGLGGYLITGNDVPTEQIDQMRGQLDPLQGHVLLVFSSAFNAAAQTLNPKSPLRHIATFFTTGTPVTFKELPDESAKLGSGHDDISPAKKQPSQAAMSGRIATYALLFMFIFTGLIIWIGS